MRDSKHDKVGFCLRSDRTNDQQFRTEFEAVHSLQIPRGMNQPQLFQPGALGHASN